MAKAIRGLCILQKAVLCEMREFANAGAFSPDRAGAAKPGAEEARKRFKEKFGRKSA
jgi:hypothetical protein